ncbi:ABC transporter permease [Homoserinibacter sp. GY 40078]|uniref:ABC transporter permease n=1 Tax=Homoserinibacter sp. GY 40078 TaxID=2603275 RepID=UPI0011C9A3D4|nr:FtsX-like permease family protein [Homoserinibacter sp. GY 40078]TXK18814.1 ABC transporter permease [Homoserinibacter sp. GY 40078]
MRFPGPASWLGISIRRRFSIARSLVLTVAGASLVVSALVTPTAALAGSVADSLGGESALAQIEVAAADLAASGITSAQLDRIREIPGVADVRADASVGVYGADGETWSMTLQVLNPALLPPDAPADLDAAVRGPAIVVPTAVGGTTLEVSPGDELRVTYSRLGSDGAGRLEERALPVVATYAADWQGYGPDAALASEALVVELLAARSGLSADDFLRTQGIPAATVVADSADEVSAITESIRDLGLTAVPVRDRLGELPGMFAIFPALLAVVGAAVGILLVLHLNRAIRTAVARRTDEFALLRIRGWTKGQVTRLVIADVALGAALGAVLGTIAGVGPGALLISSLAPTLEPQWDRVVLAAGGLAALTALMCAAAAWLVAVRVLRADPYLTAMSRDR